MLAFLLAACAPEEKPDVTVEPLGTDTGCDAVSGWRDADGDGFGAGDPVEACSGLVTNADDCDDGDATIHPGADELCDGVDADCDGTVEDPTVRYADGDGDGYGDATSEIAGCEPGGVADATDCDDNDAAVHPAGEEACDGVDQDCDGEIDEGLEDCGGSTGGGGFGGAYDLAAADAKIYGPANYGLGSYLEVGDLTGDGIDDVLASAYLANSADGGGYVVPGPLTGVGSVTSNGYFLRGTSDSWGAGRSIGVGDVDGDGFLDVSFGAPYDTVANGTWILFGPFDADRNLVDDHDVYLQAPWGSMGGHGGDLADVNGDGVEDALVGCWGADEGDWDSGSVFVKYGPLAPGDVDLTTDADAQLVGEGEDAESGRIVRGGVDLDGDGIGDLISLAPSSSVFVPTGGLVYVEYGPPMGTIDLGGADGRLLGTDASEYAGWTGALGDVNGDGLGDVVVGSLSDRAASNAGRVYVVYGPASGDVALTAADIVIDGVAADQWLGSSVATRDIDGDGFSDLLAGAVLDPTSGVDTGAAYLFLAPTAGAYTTADADAALYGEHSGDWAGMGVALGDLDADGLGDLLVSAPSEDSGGTAGGAIYVQYAAP